MFSYRISFRRKTMQTPKLAENRTFASKRDASLSFECEKKDTLTYTRIINYYIANNVNTHAHGEKRTRKSKTCQSYHTFVGRKVNFRKITRCVKCARDHSSKLKILVKKKKQLAVFFENKKRTRTHARTHIDQLIGKKN